jgi:hypothetical protein
MSHTSLVRPLFEGPVDIVADVHGEIEALDRLLTHLGYHAGVHPLGRHLVFLGDLTDRGPDSPAVVDFVNWLVALELAQCILGNHDLNLLLEHRKEGNHWYFGEAERMGRDPVFVCQAPASAATRDRVRWFFKSLPLVLHRPDLRIVHACWDDEAIQSLDQADDVLALYHGWVARIDADLQQKGIVDPVEQEQAHQNRNPVKLVTSGPEKRAPRPFWSGGRERFLDRVPWWDHYSEGPLVVFGHYGMQERTPEQNALAPQDDASQVPGSARAVCIDFGVGKRWRERLRRGEAGPFSTRLAAFRFPERELVFDDGTSWPRR